jgi:hypothetical protein
MGANLSPIGCQVKVRRCDSNWLGWPAVPARSPTLPRGIEVAPWTRHTLQRHPETRSATISLFIEFEQGDEDRRPVN